MTEPNVAAVALNIAQACVKAGRDPESVRLMAVSKQVGAGMVRKAASMGVTLFGENHVQEARDKSEEGAFKGATLCLIGHLQTNKASLAARVFDEVHSVDTVHVAEALSRFSLMYRGAGRPLTVLIEVNAGEDPAKYGVMPDEAADLVKAVMGMPGLVVRGLMTVAPGHGEGEVARRAFRRLFDLKAELARSGVPLENLKELSMGMSADYPLAIEEGSTIVRIGTALFGPRQ